MDVKRTDHSGIPEEDLPPIPEQDLLFYHWSPSRNRSSIERVGLMPGKMALGLEWRAPYICFAGNPFTAWVLSGQRHANIGSWDLWMCHVPSQTSFGAYELITDTTKSGHHYIKEYRVYERIFKRDLWYVASRAQREKS